MRVGSDARVPFYSFSLEHSIEGQTKYQPQYTIDILLSRRVLQFLFCLLNKVKEYLLLHWAPHE